MADEIGVASNRCVAATTTCNSAKSIERVPLRERASSRSNAALRACIQWNTCGYAFSCIILYVCVCSWKRHSEVPHTSDLSVHKDQHIGQLVGSLRSYCA